MLRGLSGMVAAGVVVLAVVVVGAAYVGGNRNFPGPGTEAIVWHLVAAVLAITAQILADRTRGAVAAGASLLVVGIAAALLWTQWWG